MFFARSGHIDAYRSIVGEGIRDGILYEHRKEKIRGPG